MPPRDPRMLLSPLGLFLDVFLGPLPSLEFCLVRSQQNHVSKATALTLWGGLSGVTLSHFGCLCFSPACEFLQRRLPSCHPRIAPRGHSQTSRDNTNPAPTLRLAQDHRGEDTCPKCPNSEMVRPPVHHPRMHREGREPSSSQEEKIKFLFYSLHVCSTRTAKRATLNSYIHSIDPLSQVLVPCSSAKVAI